MIKTLAKSIREYKWAAMLCPLCMVGEVFMEVLHAYPDITVHLTLFHATISEGVPQKLEHNDIRNIRPSEIDNYEFCPADVEILKKIKEVYHG